MITEEQKAAALHELDFNIMRGGTGEIVFKMNQHTLDTFWRNHFETIRESLTHPQPQSAGCETGVPFKDAIRLLRACLKNWPYDSDQGSVYQNVSIFLKCHE